MCKSASAPSASFPIPLRSLFAVHPELLAPVLQIIHRSIATFLFKQTGQKRDQAVTGAVTLIRRFGSTTNVRYKENWNTPMTDSNWPNADSQLKLGQPNLGVYTLSQVLTEPRTLSDTRSPRSQPF
jgi:hypothetical protein